MASKGVLREEAKLIFWIGGIFVTAWLLWFYSGGQEQALNEIISPSIQQSRPSATSAHSQQATVPASTPAYSGTQSNYSYTQTQREWEKNQALQKQVDDLTLKIREAQYEKQQGGVITNKSPLYKKVTLAIGSVGTNKAAQEYMILRADSNNNGPIRITDWSLRSIETESGATIGKGTLLPYGDGYPGSEPLQLFPGDVAYVISGVSPLQTSFRSNKCLGYFGQYQVFTPGLAGYCPSLRSETLPPKPNRLSEECINFIMGIPSCTVPTYFPEYVNVSCQTYIVEHTGYDRCVQRHKNDADFYQKDLRIYLGRNGTLWRSRLEMIELRDEKGQVVDRITY